MEIAEDVLVLQERLAAWRSYEQFVCQWHIV
jgi:hypothetical protein